MVSEHFNRTTQPYEQDKHGFPTTPEISLPSGGSSRSRGTSYNGPSTECQYDLPAEWQWKPSKGEMRQLCSGGRDRLYASFGPLVRRLVSKYGLDAETREDLRGEIYCCFCRLLEEYDPQRGIPLRAYMVRALTTAVYGYARSQRAWKGRETSLDATPETPELSDPSSPVHGWEDDLLSEDVCRALPEALKTLPARQQQAVIYRYYGAHSYAAVADLLHVAPATARSLVRNGIRSLRITLRIEI